MKHIERHIEQILSAGIQYEDKVLYHILVDLTQEKKSFLKLIQDPSYNFDDGLSARMRSWYDEKGLLVSDRNPEKQGKRKLSFVNKVWFELVVYCKNSGLKFERIKDFQTILLQPISKYGFTLLELYTLTALCNLNLEDYFMKLDIEQGFPLASSKVSFDIPETGMYVNLSRLLRDSLFYGWGIKNEEDGKSIDFHNFYYQLAKEDNKFNIALVRFIEGVRKRLSLPLLAENEILSQDAKASFTALSYRPSSSLRRRWDVLFEDDQNNLFGLEIKFVGKSRFVNSEDERFICKKDEELIKSIKDEINGYLKFIRNRVT